MKKKSLAILCCIALVMMGSSSHAQDIGDVVISDNAVVIPAGCEVSKILTNRLASAVGDELIPITIRLVDNIDLDEVELLAMEQVGVTAIQLEESDSMTQQEMYHRVSAKRTAILGSYYQELNQNFLSSVGLDNNDYESVSRLLPYIRGIRLTKSQIIALAHHPQVCYMDLYEDVTGEDYASIGDTRQIIG